MAPTVRPVVKARTPTSVPGSERRRAGGFTLVELLTVLLLIALASGLASLALRDPQASRLDQEAVRLVALLEAARAEARAGALPVRFELTPAEAGGHGFRFVGLPPGVQLPQQWLNDAVQAEIADAAALRLGPEPLIGAQRITLRLGTQQVALATDGLAPFAPLAAAAAAP